MSSLLANSMLNLLIRIPFYVSILFLFYLLARGCTSLINGFSVSFNFSSTTTSILNIITLSFFVFIAILITINFFKIRP